MNNFPDFMKNQKNRVPVREQNTEDIKGYYFRGEEGRQVAFWTCSRDRTSRRHVNDFDEYMVCIQGQYTVYFDGKEFILNPGDDLHIPKGVEQWGRCISGTRSIHFFDGERIKNP